MKEKLRSGSPSLQRRRGDPRRRRARIEVKEKKTVDDALNATRAAVEEGVVPGGGSRFCARRRRSARSRATDADIQAGVQIVSRRWGADPPIVRTRGVEGSIVVGKVLENKSQTFGFTLRLKPMSPVEAGIHRSGKSCAPRSGCGVDRLVIVTTRR